MDVVHPEVEFGLPLSSEENFRKFNVGIFKELHIERETHCGQKKVSVSTAAQPKPVMVTIPICEGLMHRGTLEYLYAKMPGQISNSFEFTIFGKSVNFVAHFLTTLSIGQRFFTYLLHL